MEKTKIRIAFLSTYPPRECGIATFAKSLIKTFDSLYVKNQVKVIAVSDQLNKYRYSPRVICEIDQFKEQSYIDAARFINDSNIEVVVLQHEYGIFGGVDGEHIIKFLENVNRPVVTSLHSVLRLHSEHRLEITQRILDLSSSVVVMTRNAKKILTELFKIDPKKIHIVPHGVPNVRFDEKYHAKELLGVKDRIVLSTFGLINRGKGIENAINALSKVVKKFPDVLYLIIGATHPDILKKEGEAYREELAKLVEKSGLKKNIVFINQYLEYDELVYFLRATDIYLGPNLDLHQAFSGTLSYALGCGCAIISSPTAYAIEMLNSHRGIVTDVDYKKIANAIMGLLESKEQLFRLQLKAYKFSRKMVWHSVGLEYLRVVESNLFMKEEKWIARLPDVNQPPALDHLYRMTDNFGIIQHTTVNTPDMRYGYSLDDQARALIAVQKYLDHFELSSEHVSKLPKIYYRYLEKAIDQNGNIHNFINKNRKYIDEEASQDSIARSFWSLAYYYQSKSVDSKLKNRIKAIIEQYEKKLNREFVQPLSYYLLGLTYLGNKPKILKIADIIIDRITSGKTSGWFWYQDTVTWGSAIIPYALMRSYRITKRKKYFEVTHKLLSFLEKHCSDNDMPCPIGQNGWLKKGEDKAMYDQQPIEPAKMVLLYNEMFDLTRRKIYRDKAYQWFGWYYGNNVKKIMVFNDKTKGIYDGITVDGLNTNQGAESIVTYLMAYLSFSNGL